VLEELQKFRDQDIQRLLSHIRIQHFRRVFTNLLQCSKCSLHTCCKLKARYCLVSIKQVINIIYVKQDCSCSKMAVSCHLGYYRTGYSAIRSADPENPSLEPDMEWIGCTVCEIFAFKLYCDLETGVWGHSRSLKVAP